MTFQFISKGELEAVLDIADFPEKDRAEIAYQYFVNQNQESVYIEENGILAGIVSIGDLERYYGNGQDKLKPNRHFSYTQKADEEKAAAFFEKFRTFFEIPVVDDKGRLEGVMRRSIRRDIRQAQIASLVVSRHLKEQWHRRELNCFLANTKAKVVLYYIEMPIISRKLADRKNPASAGGEEKTYWKGLSESQWNEFLGEPDAVGKLKREFGNFHTEMVKGVSEIVAMEGEFYHCADGSRVTLENPVNPEINIVFYGPCVIAGAYCRDRQTIESCLQRKLNLRGKSQIRVINRGLFNVTNYFSRMMTDELSEKDIAVVYVEKRWLTEEMAQKCIYVGNLTDAYLSIEDLENNILDSPEHCNYKVNECLAERIYHDFAEHKLLEAKGASGGAERIQDYYIGSEVMAEVLRYMEHNNLLTGDDGGIRGAMALLADPFTDRHRRAVEAALRKVDRLYFFIAEDSNLTYTLEERIQMTKKAVEDLGGNIIIVPSGKYLYTKKISRGIRKQRFCDDEMEYDCDIFGQLFGGCLGIRYRFVVKELDNPVERSYMDTCSNILPRFGMIVEEL